MSERSERLLRDVGGIREQWVEEAEEEETAPRKKKGGWKRFAALAACLALVILGAGVLTGRIPLPGVGGGGGLGVNVNREPLSYMNYAGPVLPLTLAEANDAITAQREVTLDFQPWVPTWKSVEDMLSERTFQTEEGRQRVLESLREQYPDGGEWETSSSILVQDTNRLHNTSGEDQTVTVLYPFISSLDDLADTGLPSLTLDGQLLDPEVRFGRVSAALPEEDPDDGRLENFGLYLLDSWDDYEELLRDGSYLSGALEFRPEPSGTAFLYTVSLDSEPEMPEESSQKPQLNLRFRVNQDQTAVWTLGSNSRSLDPESGTMEIRGISPVPLLVLGDDIQDLEVECQARVGEEWQTVEAEISVERREAAAEEILRELAEEEYAYKVPPAVGERGMPFDLYYDLFLDGLEFGLRYEEGSFSPGSYGMERVFFLMAEVTIPAESSVELTAVLEMPGSYDYECGTRDGRGSYGYDLATRVGSVLEFTDQTGILEDRGQIEIVSQNYGFNLKKGIREVPLTEDRYWLVVRRAPEAEVK